MNRIVQIQTDFKDVLKSRSLEASIILLAFTLPYPIQYFNIAFIAFILIWVINFGKRFHKNLKAIFSNRLVLLFTSLYVVNVLGLGYSKDQTTGLFLLEKKIALLLFPILLCLVSFNKKQIDRILYSFLLSTLGASLICLFYYLNQYIQGNNNFIGVFELFDRELFCSAIDLYPTYFGIYVTFSIFIILNFLIRDWQMMSMKMKYLFIITLLFLVSIDFLLAARTPLIMLVLVGSTLYLRFWLKQKILGTFLFLGALGFFLIFIFIFKGFGNRFKELYETKWSPPVGIYHNSTNLRIGIFHCTIEVLKTHWLLGLGTGGVQSQLDSCYKANGFSDELSIGHYNTHNEYFNVWLNNGISGLLIFVTLLFVSVKMAYRQNSMIYISFLLLIFFCCLTESILERNKGVVFFAFFSSLFAFNHTNKSKVQ